MSIYLDPTQQVSFGIDQLEKETKEKKQQENGEYSTPLDDEQVKRYYEVMKEEHWVIPQKIVPRKLQKVAKSLHAFVELELPALVFSFSGFCDNLTKFFKSTDQEFKVYPFGGALRYILCGLPYTDRDLGYTIHVQKDAQGLAKDIRKCCSAFLLEVLLHKWKEERHDFPESTQIALGNLLGQYADSSALERQNTCFEPIHELLYLRYINHFVPVSGEHGDPTILSFDFQGIDLTGTHIYPWTLSQVPLRQNRSITDGFRCTIPSFGSNERPHVYCVNRGKVLDKAGFAYSLQNLKTLKYIVEAPKEVSHLFFALSYNQLLGFHIENDIIYTALAQLQEAYPSTENTIHQFAEKFIANQKKHYKFRNFHTEKNYSEYIEEPIGLQLDLIQTLINLHHFDTPKSISYIQSISKAWLKSYHATCNDQAIIHFLRLLKDIPEESTLLIQLIISVLLEREQELTNISLIIPPSNTPLTLWKLKICTPNRSSRGVEYRGRQYFLTLPWTPEFLCKTLPKNLEKMEKRCIEIHQRESLHILQQEIHHKQLKKKLFLNNIQHCLMEAKDLRDEKFGTLFKILKSTTQKHPVWLQIVNAFTQILKGFTKEDILKTFTEREFWQKTIREGTTYILQRTIGLKDSDLLLSMFDLIIAAYQTSLISKEEKEKAVAILLQSFCALIVSSTDEKQLIAFIHEINRFLNMDELSDNHQQGLGEMIAQLISASQGSSHKKLHREVCRLFVQIKAREPIHPFVYASLGQMNLEKTFPSIKSASHSFLAESTQAFSVVLSVLASSESQLKCCYPLYLHLLQLLISVPNPKAWVLAAELTKMIFTPSFVPSNEFRMLWKQLSDKLFSVSDEQALSLERKRQDFQKLSIHILEMHYCLKKEQGSIQEAWQQILKYLSEDHSFEHMQINLGAFASELAKGVKGQVKWELFTKDLLKVVSQDFSINIKGILSQFLRLTIQFDLRVAEELFYILEKREFAIDTDFLNLWKVYVQTNQTQSAYRLSECWGKKILINKLHASSNEDVEILTFLLSHDQLFPVIDRQRLADHLLEIIPNITVQDQKKWEESVILPMFNALTKYPLLTLLERSVKLWQLSYHHGWITLPNIPHSVIGLINGYKSIWKPDLRQKSEITVHLKNLLRDCSNLNLSEDSQNEIVHAYCQLIQQCFMYTREKPRNIDLEWGNEFFQALLSSRLVNPDIHDKILKTTCLEWIGVLAHIWKRHEPVIDQKQLSLIRSLILSYHILDNGEFSPANKSTAFLGLITNLGYLYRQEGDIKIQREAFTLFKEHRESIFSQLVGGDRLLGQDLLYSINLLTLFKSINKQNLSKIQKIVLKHLKSNPLDLALPLLAFFLNLPADVYDEEHHPTLDLLLQHMVKHKWISSDNCISIFTLLKNSFDEVLLYRGMFIHQIFVTLCSHLKNLDNLAKKEFFALTMSLSEQLERLNCSGGLTSLYSIIRPHLLNEDANVYLKMCLDRRLKFSAKIKEYICHGKFINLTPEKEQQLLEEAEWVLPLYCLEEFPAKEEGQETVMLMGYAALEKEVPLLKLVQRLIYAAKHISLFTPASSEHKSQSNCSLPEKHSLDDLENLWKKKFYHHLKTAPFNLRSSQPQGLSTKEQLNQILEGLGNDESKLQSFISFHYEWGMGILTGSIESELKLGKELYFESITTTMKQSDISNDALSHFMFTAVIPNVWKLLFYPLMAGLISERVFRHRGCDYIDEGFAKLFKKVIQVPGEINKYVDVAIEYTNISEECPTAKKHLANILQEFPAFVDSLDQNSIQKFVSLKCRGHMHQNALLILLAMQHGAHKCVSNVFAQLLRIYQTFGKILIMASRSNTEAPSETWNCDLFLDCLEKTIQQLPDERIHNFTKLVVQPYLTEVLFWPDVTPQIIEHFSRNYAIPQIGSRMFTQKFQSFLASDAAKKFMVDYVKKCPLEKKEASLVSTLPDVLACLGTNEVRLLWIEPHTEYTNIMTRAYPCKLLNILRYEIFRPLVNDPFLSQTFRWFGRCSNQAVHHLLTQCNEAFCSAFFDCLTNVLQAELPPLLRRRFLSTVVKPYLTYLSFYPVFLFAIKDRVITQDEDSTTVSLSMVKKLLNEPGIMQFFERIALEQGAKPTDLPLIKTYKYALDELSPKELKNIFESDRTLVLTEITKTLKFYSDYAKALQNEPEFSILDLEHMQKTCQACMNFLSKEKFHAQWQKEMKQYKNNLSHLLDKLSL